MKKITNILVSRFLLVIRFICVVLFISSSIDSFTQNDHYSYLFHVQASFALINSRQRFHSPFATYHQNDISSNHDRLANLQRGGLLPMAKKSTEQILTKQWLPRIHQSDDDIYASDIAREQLENECIQYVASLVMKQLESNNNINGLNDLGSTVIIDEERIDNDQDNNEHDIDFNTRRQIVRDKFRDLTCKIEGEKLLEDLFIHNPPHCPVSLSSLSQECNDMNILRGGIMAMQSLLIMGMQVGVKGTQEHQKRLVEHLNDYYISSSQESFESYFDNITPKQLKHQIDTTAGVKLLSELKRKRTTQGAYDLLVLLGAWDKHEDIALLRSGFPTRFSDEEIKAALDAENRFNGTSDPDDLLGLRKDLRSLKVYTIDSEYTHEIDDGLSIELIKREDGSKRHRVWIHIADADRWATRDSKIFEAAQSRATSVYTPSGSISMFPSNLSTGVMSLRADRDSYALSLSVELNEDGSIDENTISVSPSIIKVDYRLTYDEVDEMLDMGVGYFEEWELGALLGEANKRRKFRIANGSTEGFVPNPIPQAELRVEMNEESEDGIDIILKVEGSHNAGYNQSSTELDTNPSTTDNYAPPVSSSSLLVTEMMILSGEAMGKFKYVAESAVNVAAKSTLIPQLKNTLDLPYRMQPKPDFSRRYQELNTLESLKERGYCHAWYARRFFEAVRVTNRMQPHYGLGLDCYVQWSSPIRRFGDLQVHASVKRFLRIARINQLMRLGKPIPPAINPSDIGCVVPKVLEDSKDESGLITKYLIDEESRHLTSSNLSIDYRKGLGFIKAARILQKKSNEYWLFEYIRRCVDNSDNDIEFEVTILALVDPDRYQYAIYVHELGLEHRYLSQTGELKPGSKLLMKVDSVSPRYGLLTFSLSTKYVGGRRKAAKAA